MTALPFGSQHADSSSSEMGPRTMVYSNQLHDADAGMCRGAVMCVWGVEWGPQHTPRGYPFLGSRLQFDGFDFDIMTAHINWTLAGAHCQQRRILFWDQHIIKNLMRLCCLPRQSWICVRLQDQFLCVMAWISVEFTLIKYIYLSLCGSESIISIQVTKAVVLICMLYTCIDVSVSLCDLSFCPNSCLIAHT